MMDGMSIADEFDNAEPAERPREIDIELDPPITVDKKQFTRLHLKEPTALQIQRAEFEIAGGANHHNLRKYQIALVAFVAAVPVEVVQRIRITELGEAWSFLEPFTPLYRLTGESLWRTLPDGGAGDRMMPGA